MSVARAQEEISSQEFVLWQAFNRQDPYGQWRADAVGGIIAATIANANRGKGSRSYKPKDFVMEFKPKTKPVPMTAEEISRFMNGMMRQVNSAQGLPCD